MRGYWIKAGVVLGASLVTTAGCSQDLKWSAVETLIESSFPDVSQISADSLAALMADSSEAAVLLFDTRTRAEYEISHIPGAVHLDPETTEFGFLDTLETGTPIVTYCSVGYRSSEIADRLAKAGFTNASNLQGSIFRWANEGRIVIRDGAPVREVHPYDGVWGKILDKEYRTYTAGGSAD